MKNLAKFFHYLFYWGYSWSLRKYGAQDAPQMTGLAVVAFPLFLNLFTLYIAGEWLLNATLISATLPKYIQWAVALSFLVLPYWFLVRDERYLAFITELDTWDADQRWYANRRVIFYLAGSVLALCVAAYLRKNHPNPLHI